MKTVSSQVVYRNRWMSVREDAITLVNGEASVYGVVEKDDFAVVIPWHKERFHLVRQFRYPVGDAFLEFPQGSCPDAPELSNDQVALRELKEETGFSAARIQHLGTLYEAYGFCTQRMHVFLATDITEGKQDLEPEEEGMTLASFTREELEELMTSGRIRDAATLAAYGLLLLSEKKK